MFGCGVQSFPPHAANCNSTAGMRVDPLNGKPFRFVIIRSSKSAFSGCIWSLWPRLPFMQS